MRAQFNHLFHSGLVLLQHEDTEQMGLCRSDFGKYPDASLKLKKRSFQLVQLLLKLRNGKTWKYVEDIVHCCVVTSLLHFCIESQCSPVCFLLCLCNQINIVLLFYNCGYISLWVHCACIAVNIASSGGRRRQRSKSTLPYTAQPHKFSFSNIKKEKRHN